MRTLYPPSGSAGWIGSRARACLLPAASTVQPPCPIALQTASPPHQAEHAPGCLGWAAAALRLEKFLTHLYWRVATCRRRPSPQLSRSLTIKLANSQLVRRHTGAKPALITLEHAT